MVTPVIAFSCGFVVILIGAIWFLRGAIFAVTSQAAEHAKTYAIAYVKGGALVAIAMLAAFEQAFHPLTTEMALKLAWWDWAILFFKPLAAGLAVIVAFLDRSVTRAKEEKAATTPPFVQPVIPPNS